jgi:Ca2+/H+ antiporter, TMEM165/GDT1 family
MAALIASLILIFLAEMGDKTQLLAMAFSARYKPWKVLLGVFIGTVANISLAVAAGRLLTRIVPLGIISFIAALSFIGFGLWILKRDELHGEEKRESKFGPVTTVAAAFFLAEMGDKTQLAAISLAVQYQNALGVLSGATAGMVAADALGIIVGMVMRKHIPEKTIKWVSAIIFILFGLYGMYNVLFVKA